MGRIVFTRASVPIDQRDSASRNEAPALYDVDGKALDALRRRATHGVTFAEPAADLFAQGLRAVDLCVGVRVALFVKHSASPGASVTTLDGAWIRVRAGEYATAMTYASTPTPPASALLSPNHQRAVTVTPKVRGSL